jgi:hypothetical protein
MKPDTVLTLGDFEFSRYEVPEKIAFGGEQALVVHQLVGGVRVVDAMGRIDGPLEWSGLFVGETALDRARYLDGLRVAGLPLSLRWSDLAYTVVIRSFRCEFERFYKLPYSISCVVVDDLTLPVSNIAPPGVDEWIANDMAQAKTLGDAIGDAQLSGLLQSLDSAISAVSSFANAVQSTINSVLAPLAAVQSRVRILIGSVGNVLSNVTTLGGILPNNPIAQQAARLNGQLAAMTQLPQLYTLQSVLGRIGGNLGSVGAAGRSVSVAGGNLYQLAADAYGDAASWTAIASANGLTDPLILGVQTVTVPPVPGDSGGVLHA